MKHYTLEQWDLYAGERLSEEESLAYETHLSSCDSCLELYMQSLECAADSYPMLQADAEFAEAVMGRISREESMASPASIPLELIKSSTVRRTPAFTRHPLFHYTVAAAITIILMGSGAFQSLTERIGHLETAAEAMDQSQAQGETPKVNERTSVSYKIMEKTIVMLDSIQPKQAKGGAR
ncbi:hypothetical protein GC093_17485 [Paenibacillus sp. LMG 31456]|uniref:Zinc-finger domain-containing protein n=1 Tax=Paenibacillus foliorum TaxID=2654974 RepID=A0A972GRS6_9BACL|nr:hypothetical protein [Paenibacillus foliorum]NOU95000.1 hypothetical protein [Paenibacillus foliorum]